MKDRNRSSVGEDPPKPIQEYSWVDYARRILPTVAMIGAVIWVVATASKEVDLTRYHFVLIVSICTSIWCAHKWAQTYKRFLFARDMAWFREEQLHSDREDRDKTADLYDRLLGAKIKEKGGKPTQEMAEVMRGDPSEPEEGEVLFEPEEAQTELNL